MPTNTILGGIFNYIDPVIGLQLYIWLWVGLTILSAIIWVLFYYVGWKPYTPLHGLYYAWKAGSNAAFIFDAPLHGEMVSEAVAKCIFDYSKEEYETEAPDIMFIGGIVKWIYGVFSYYPTAYLPNISPLEALVYKFGGVNKDVEIARHLQGGEWERSPSVTCGGINIDIIVDTDNWTIRTSPQHKIIEKLARQWNYDHEHNQIHSYTKFGRYLLSGDIKSSELKTSAMATWTRIDTGFPLDLEESDWAGKRRQMAEEQYDADQISKNRMALIVLSAGIGIAALIITVRLLTHFIH